MDSAKRIMSGTRGEVWLDGELVAECTACKLVMKANKEKISMCGAIGTDNKINNYDCTGNLKLLKTSSRMAELLADAISAGQDPRFVIISKLDDPDAYGAERVSVSGVSFDDLTLADWEAGKSGSVDVPFTFTGFSMLDTVDPQ